MRRVGHKETAFEYLARFFKLKKTNKRQAKKMLIQICRWMYKQKIMDAPKTTAYLTFGRWQPPHKSLLFNK